MLSAYVLVLLLVSEVSGVENIGQCDRLSSAGFWAHFNIVIYFFTSLVTYLLLYFPCYKGCYSQMVI